MPKISVIVPIYKVEDYLSRCIDSILGQTFTDFELILVDDGSPDNCGKICDEYAEKDNRIHVIHKENGGLSDARNAGIDWAFANSNSEWITFIDSDDWIHPKYLEALYNAVKETCCEISICGYEETTGDSPIVDESQLQAVMVNTEDFFCEHNVNAVIACAKLYKKELFREIRYPVGKLHEDEFTTYQILFVCRSIICIYQPLYAYFQNQSGITKGKWSPRKIDVIEAIFMQSYFFDMNNYPKAFNYASNALRHTIVNFYEVVKNDQEYGIYKKRLRKDMRKYLRLYSRNNGISIKSHPYCYEIGYPFTMKIYWYCVAFVNKIKRNHKCPK